MHATYCFLIPLPAKGTDDYPRYALSLFKQFISEYGSDDSGYQEQYFVLPDGRSWGLCPDDDWRGRQIVQEELGKIPMQLRYGEARRFAYRCVLAEMNYGRVDPDESDSDSNLSIDEIENKIRTIIPKEIIALYRKYIAQSLSNNKNPTDDWKRRNLSDRFETFIACPTPPFTQWLSIGPSKYRCFDLSDYLEHDQEYTEDGILLVDIHT